MENTKKKCPEAGELPTARYARAEGCGIWLTREAGGGFGSARDFGKAAAFDTAEEASKAWAQMTAAAAAAPKSGEWTRKGCAIFEGLKPGEEPGGLTVFLAMCQGRFVGQKVGYNNSVDWCLSPDIGEARLFASRAQAVSALERVRPAMPKGESPRMAVLPLAGVFGAPVAVEGCPVDGKASSMAARAARESISDAAGEVGAPAPRARRPGL